MDDPHQLTCGMSIVVGKKSRYGTYAAVVGSSFNDLTENGISLSLHLGVLGLELAAVLDVFAHLVVGESHVDSVSDPGYRLRWHTRMSVGIRDDNTHFMKNSSARPTSAGTDPGTMWRLPGAPIVSPGTWVYSALVGTDG